MNSNRMYFFSGGTETESWSQIANNMWPLYSQTDKNSALFGGRIGVGGGVDLLRQLKPKKYKYKDVIAKGNTPVWGLIAQDVEEDTIPYATEVIEGIVPNIYEMATVSNSNVITFTNFNTSNIESNSSTIEALTANSVREKNTLEEIIDEHTFVSKKM
jgi:hypothetical protein